MCKIVLIGAGRIGKELINEILRNPTKYAGITKLIVFIPAGHDAQCNHLRGYLKDLKPTLSSEYRDKFAISHDQNVFADAEALIITAAGWPTEDEKQQYAQRDPTGRLVQYTKNTKIITDIASQLSGVLNPSAKVFVITNPVDLIAEKLRKLLTTHQVFGVSTIVDEHRFKHVFSRLLCKRTEGLYSSQPDVSACIVGSHSPEMVLLKNSIRIGDQPIDLFDQKMQKIIADAMSKVGVFGKRISVLQQDHKHPDIDTGAAILPSYLLARIIKACSSQDQDAFFTCSLNARIDDANVANKYGIPVGTSLSVAMIISRTDHGIKVCFDDSVNVALDELAAIKKAQDTLTRNTALMEYK